MGVRLVIDDFGTGYSSFSYLRHFSAEKLKIDRSFVRDIVTSCDDAAIASAIISMGKSLHIKVIAEGVESEAQMDFLRENHCDEIQGNYLSEAVPAGQAGSMLRRIEGSQVSAAVAAKGTAGFGVMV
jgi:EAL domain-containing protein (putative c-di-GMP-specific phosphodiesterase class I)